MEVGRWVGCRGFLGRLGRFWGSNGVALNAHYVGHVEFSGEEQNVSQAWLPITLVYYMFWMFNTLYMCCIFSIMLMDRLIFQFQSPSYDFTSERNVALAALATFTEM